MVNGRGASFLIFTHKSRAFKSQIHILLQVLPMIESGNYDSGQSAIELTERSHGPRLSRSGDSTARRRREVTEIH